MKSSQMLTELVSNLTARQIIQDLNHYPDDGDCKC